MSSKSDTSTLILSFLPLYASDEKGKRTSNRSTLCCLNFNIENEKNHTQHIQCKLIPPNSHHRFRQLRRATWARVYCDQILVFSDPIHCYHDNDDGTKPKIGHKVLLYCATDETCGGWQNTSLKQFFLLWSFC